MNGYKEETDIKSFAFLIWFFLLTFVFALSGCSHDYDVSFHSGAKHRPGMKESFPSISRPEFIPIDTGDEEFYKAVGWLGDESIVYLTNKGEISSLYKYNPVTGVSTQLYRSDDPIFSAEIGPGRKVILLHQAVSNKTVLTWIDLSGKEIFATEFKAFEVNFEWNPFDVNLIAVSAFTEDWNYNTYLVDISNKRKDKIELPEPFVRWVSKNEMVYQKWDEDEVSLEAPLNVFNIANKNSRMLLPSLYQFDTIGEYLVTVNVPDESAELAEYRLYSKEKERIATIKFPELTSYSGWLIPYYDLIGPDRGFLYLRPPFGGEADIYNGGFDLMYYGFDTHEEELLLPELDNEPISCSPVGEKCLYGYQFEKVINLEKREIFELVKQS